MCLSPLYRFRGDPGEIEIEIEMVEPIHIRKWAPRKTRPSIYRIDAKFKRHLTIGRFIDTLIRYILNKGETPLRNNRRSPFKIPKKMNRNYSLLRRLRRAFMEITNISRM